MKEHHNKKMLHAIANVADGDRFCAVRELIKSSSSSLCYSGIDVPFCVPCKNMQIVPCHARHANNAGMGLKPSNEFVYYGCLIANNHMNELKPYESALLSLSRAFIESRHKEILDEYRRIK